MDIKISKLRNFVIIIKKIVQFFIFLIIIFSTILLFDNVSSKNLTNSTNSTNSTNTTNTKNSTNVSNNDKCYPNKIKKNLVFLKTHKCASSAIQNIFLRFGYNNNLKFVLPMKGNYLGHPALFTKELVPSGKYNIITHHTRLNYPEMCLIMPEDTVYITILRNPITMFESLYNYYKLEKFYKFKFDLLNSDNLTVIPNFSKRFANRIGLNQMFYDLGFDLKNSKLTDYQPYIKYLDSIFDLVMIEEYMDESLVLLKNLLCWSIDDVVTFKVNARIKKDDIGDLATKRIKKLNQADVQLYDYFLDKFKQKITVLDKKKLEKDVEELKSRRKYWFDECVDTQNMKPNFKITNDLQLNILRFSTKKDNLTCKFLTSKELELTKLVREHQLKLYPESVFTSVFQRTKSRITKNQKKKLFHRI